MILTGSGRFFVYVCISLYGLFALPNASAMFARLSEAELVSTADIIVSGHYVGEDTISLPGQDQEARVGVIKVDRVYCGDKGQSLLYFSLPPAGISRSDTIALEVGQEGIWFLVAVKMLGNLYWFNHPQRLLPKAEGLVLLKKFGLAQ